MSNERVHIGILSIFECHENLKEKSTKAVVIEFGTCNQNTSVITMKLQSCLPVEKCLKHADAENSICTVCLGLSVYKNKIKDLGYALYFQNF